MRHDYPHEVEDAMRVLETDVAALREENARLREALQQAGYALDLSVRSLRAWVNPVMGMGANISSENRGRWAMAIREYEKARPLIDAALAVAKGE